MEKQRWEEPEKRRAEERRSEKIEKRKGKKKEDSGAQKGRKVAKHCVFFSMICVSGGSKSRLAKMADAEPCRQMKDDKLHAVVARTTFGNQNVQNISCPDHFWKLRCQKKSTPLWRGAKHISKSKRTKHTNVGPLLDTFGSCDVEKLHAVVARSTFRSLNVQNTTRSEHFWKLRCSKSVRGCGPNHISKSKCTKHTTLRALLEVEMFKKCRRLWREAHFQVRSAKNWRVRMGTEHFWTFGCRFTWRAQGFAPCQRWATRDGFLACPKTMAGVGHLKKIWKDAFSVASAVQETWSLGQGADFLRKVAFWSIRSSVFVLQVQHFVWPGFTFSWQAPDFRDMDWKSRKTHWYEAVSSALNFPLLKEISQNWIVFDVANFENWGSLAELLPFWRYQVQKFKSWGSLAGFQDCRLQIDR